MGPCDIFVFVVANNPVGGDGGVTYRAMPLFPSQLGRADSADPFLRVGAVDM